MAVWLVACAADRGGEPSRPTRREGEALRDRMIELRLQGVDADREQHRAALATSLGDGFVRTCIDTLPPAQVRCGKAAADTAALAACARP